MYRLTLILSFICTFKSTLAINGAPIPGKFEISSSKTVYPLFTMYKGSHIELRITCNQDDGFISWILKKHDCISQLSGNGAQADNGQYCNSDGKVRVNDSVYFSEEQPCSTAENGDVKDESCSVLKQMLLDPDYYCNTSQLFNEKKSKSHPHRIAVAWDDGIYELNLCLKSKSAVINFSATVDVKNSQEEYLSAVDWPLLPFFSVMCGVYIILGVVWLLLMMCHWTDLLQLQFWIGFVILLGMIEKAAFLAEYESLNISGTSAKGALMLAEGVSCLKRTVARILIIIVSLGFGIVKPRLGPVMTRIEAVGLAYFVLAITERYVVIYGIALDFEVSLFVLVPLSVCDALICWWIFSSLIQTMRTLRLRHNIIKLSLYRHFTNTLIFAVLASVVFMIWSAVEHKRPACIYDWKELWVDDAVWHLLFSIILIVIMILWRPSANSQQYAFSPLLDQDEEDGATESLVHDAYDGMKIRGSGNSKDSKGRVYDDSLKWVEDNIPTSIIDTALPSLLDSDEEVRTTNYEMSKME